MLLLFHMLLAEISHFLGSSRKYPTTSEVNNDFFTVERSNNAIEFYSIGQVKGSGTTNQQKSYLFTDKKTVFVRRYYRLRQTDFDGKQKVSSVVLVDPLYKEFEFTVVPNPVIQGELVLHFAGIEKGAYVAVKIINATGMEVFSTDKTIVSIQDGFLTSELDLSQLTPGVYVIRVKSEKGVAHQKVVFSQVAGK